MLISTDRPFYHCRYQPRWLAAAVAFSCSAAVLGQPAPAEQFRLEVSPSVCVSYNRDEPCTMPLQLRWQGPPAPEVCLHEERRAPLLQCWQQSREGELEWQFSSNSDVLYLLQLPGTGGTADRAVADASVKVINRDLRNSRKRRRHVWSIL